ncbi:PREDICTED: Fanconi anemia group M protein [Nipponia nippon]|uniref:Fanconi anemia group M protein n=1 Tax=Nipponia nippon TaxID=128390 RepID=UPI0005119D41|nr:PREDICTED: Fanconi anemia group M protein [Nipponia nippon]
MGLGSGGTQALSRKELWTTKRVFFLTPQIMVNDLSRGTCPAVEIKCLVIDEAHKALGNHAYCQVVRELSKYTNQFRILALSATPGSDTKAVQQVISNLLIAQIELCAEDSPEIQPYSHERQVEKIVVPLGEELVEIQNTYIRVLETFAGRLIKIGVLARRDIPSLTKYQIILARDQHRKNPSSQNGVNVFGIHQGVIEGDFALCISLYHGYELLLQMGMRSLFIYLCGIMDGSKGLTRTKNELGRNEDFMKLYQQLRDMFSDTSLASANGNVYKMFENKKEFIYSHPKLRKLEEIVIEHFKSWKKGFMTESTSVDGVDTRVMIFSSFRDSVQEIAEMLSRLSPVVRVMTFVGHSTGKSTKGFTQKEQLEVVKRFREGGYNTLVSTCVGEEGLDIGEVDLIICFDAQKSPIRLVQRMGRTGRRRQGRIVVILAQGREERTYNQSQSNKRSIHKAISGNKMLHFYQHSPRMIPEGINPKLHKMFITAEKYEPSNSRMPSKERRRSTSLQRKSALFSCVTGQKQIHCHENWSLSPEEFEIWDRLYRIKESDGVKEPILPQIQFETLENLEEKHEEKATRELSLSEWRIWQNRAFPTSMVDHSDRCYHFISVMEMIELMRHEQGDCSYELEIKPHLRIEDVNVQRNKSHLSMTNSTFDQKARSSGKDMAHRSKGSQKDEELEVTFDLNSFIDLCDNSESAVIHESAAIKEYKTVDKDCRSLGRNHADSGYSSFTAEKSPVSSDLFYLPESYVDSFALTAAVKAREELDWNDSFDGLFDNEEFTEIQKKTPAINHTLTNKPSNKYFVQEDKDDLEMNKRNVTINEEKSIRLFEDDHVSDTNNGSFSARSKRSVKPGSGESGVRPAAERGSERPPSEVCCVSAGKACREQPISGKTAAVGMSGELSVTEAFLDTDDLYDCSQELLSVNFDLGFSIEECENEIFEEAINTNNTRKVNGTSSESEEEIVFQRKNRKKKNVLKSPDVMNDSDLESPIRAIRKRRHPLNMNAARQFLDEEAELSQQDADDVSSDEKDDAENELNSSLAQFLNDDVEVTQVLNDCEMKGVYLKSVRSPALGNRYKMVHREFNNMTIFSQIPEQDQTYAEDSFCVGEEEEETCQKSESSEEEVCVNFDLLNNESFTSGRKQYLTRRRKKLNQAGMGENCSVPMQKKKPSRIIVLSDSSGEEASVSNEKPMKTDCFWAEQEDAKLPKSLPSAPSVQPKKIPGETSVYQSVESKSAMLLGLKASVESSLKNPCRSTSVPPCPASTNPSSATALSSRDPLETKPSLCILVDSREISSGAEVISSLKAVHGVKVQVCSLSSSDYVVSNRMAVERKFLSELLNSVNRNKVTQRIQRLQSMFERICVIVEKDRIKTGETSRFFQRTQYYDGVLSALVQAGVRILFSTCQEETAGLLKDLALVEQRKNAAIRVPTEVEGHKRDVLSFYLSIPHLSYPAALNMCHCFGSVKKMANSSPLDIATGAQVSRQKAEEIYRYLHHGFDVQMLPESLCAKGRRSAAAES